MLTIENQLKKLQQRLVIKSQNSSEENLNNNSPQEVILVREAETSANVAEDTDQDKNSDENT